MPIIAGCGGLIIDGDNNEPNTPPLVSVKVPQFKLLVVTT